MIPYQGYNLQDALHGEYRCEADIEPEQHAVEAFVITFERVVEGQEHGVQQDDQNDKDFERSAHEEERR